MKPHLRLHCAPNHNYLFPEVAKRFPDLGFKWRIATEQGMSTGWNFTSKGAVNNFQAGLMVIW